MQYNCLHGLGFGKEWTYRMDVFGSLTSLHYIRKSLKWLKNKGTICHILSLHHTSYSCLGVENMGIKECIINSCKQYLM